LPYGSGTAIGQTQGGRSVSFAVAGRAAAHAPLDDPGQVATRAATSRRRTLMHSLAASRQVGLEPRSGDVGPGAAVEVGGAYRGGGGKGENGVGLRNGSPNAR
jgi:hypothetical protein